MFLAFFHSKIWAKIHFGTFEPYKQEKLENLTLKESAPIFYNGKSPKIIIKIPDLQALTLGHIKKITLYHCIVLNLNCIGIYDNFDTKMMVQELNIDIVSLISDALLTEEFIK